VEGRKEGKVQHPPVQHLGDRISSVEHSTRKKTHHRLILETEDDLLVEQTPRDPKDRVPADRLQGRAEELAGQ